MKKIFGSRKWFFAAIAIFIVLMGSMNPVFAQQKTKKKTKSPIILSLNAYSFNDLLSAKDKRDNQTLFSMFNLIDWCASKKIAAVDLTGYYFRKFKKSF